MATNAKGSAERGDQKNDTGSPDAMSAIELLEQDHREVETFFEEYEKLEDEAQKEALALKICLALQVHTQIEEEIFYPEARKAIATAELIDEAIVEHSSAKQLIGELEAMEIGDGLRDAKVKVLGEQISHHVEEEEGELFPEVEKSKMDLKTLGRRMADRKAQLLQQVAQEGEIR
jgi:hemerythrin-like domain-containing protein